ncbi:MAG: histone deacetylase [Verrucomicrobia bacterium]|nr:histone deacetylase [Verrucomicrobiota bacterium]
MIVITDSRCTAYQQPGHPERPARISQTVQRLKAQTALPIAWAHPGAVTTAQLERAHSIEHLERLMVPMDFDADTAAYPDIRAHAERSVGGALYALQAALTGNAAFSLLRPPGHHATPDRAMGFCYLNSVAIAALEALAQGIPKVAIFDFDVHHGNGTEEILLDRDRCAYFSVHQWPAYPGTGRESYNNAHNYPVAPGAPRADYRQALTAALDGLRHYRPALVGVSAGFDAYSRDPLSDAALEVEDFRWLGLSLRELGVPLFSVLEGGYSRELPEQILAYLEGLANP